MFGVVRLMNMDDLTNNKESFRFHDENSRRIKLTHLLYSIKTEQREMPFNVVARTET